VTALRDPSGNEVRFAYSTLDPGTRYPASISYSYRNGQLVGAERRITFALAPRPDPVQSFAGGVAASLTQRVVEIQSTVNGQSFRRRVLTYNEGTYTTGRSRLTSTTLYGTDGTALPSQRFTYTDPSTSLPATTGSQWAAPTAGAWSSPVAFADGSLDPGRDLGVRLGDVNGDGRLDLVRAYEDTGGAPLHEVYLNTGSGWEASPNTAWSASLAALGFSTYLTRDIGPGTSRELVPTPSKVFFSEKRDWTQPVAQSGNQSDYRAPVRAQLADVNGDGRADLVVAEEVGLWWNSNLAVQLQGVPIRQVFLNTGSGWNSVADPAYSASVPLFFGFHVTQMVYAGHSPIWLHDFGARWADLNGDGRADVAARSWEHLVGEEGQYFQGIFYHGTPGGTSGVWLNTGTSFAPGPAGLIPPVRIIEWYLVQAFGDTGARFVDVNGDGLDDS
jgi:hypothetical protein